MEILPSKLAQAILQLKGKPLNLTDYKPFELIYDLAPDILTACCGRQIGKSVSLGASIISNSILRPFFSTLFVSPLAQQTSRFSSQYLTPFCNSTIVKNHFVNTTDKKNVFMKTFNNGSNVTLAYAETEADADRVRGVAADSMFYDEIQDASLEAIPILQETLAASEFMFKRFTGTAKGESNTLSILFKRSNMMEWVVKCTHCGRHAIPNEFDTCLKILSNNPMGPACPHCSQVLDMKTGRWLAGKPSEKNHVGVHIPQFCIPARTTPKKWAGLVQKAKDYDYNKLSNEVFGLPVGAGGRPLSIRQVMGVCNPARTQFDTGFPKDERNILFTFMGVDWSVTGGVKSYTVLSVYGCNSSGKIYLLYAQRLDGMDILAQVSRVLDVYRQFECTHMGSDRGVGVLQGQLMKKALGGSPVSMINYVAAKTNLRFDVQGDFFAADRTLAIDTAVIKVKMGPSALECPCWALMETFWEDALHVFEEETQAGRRVYRKDEDAPDDFLHSLTFAMIALMIIRNDFVYQDDEAVENALFTY